MWYGFVSRWRPRMQRKWIHIRTAYWGLRWSRGWSRMLLCWDLFGVLIIVHFYSWFNFSSKVTLVIQAPRELLAWMELLAIKASLAFKEMMAHQGNKDPLDLKDKREISETYVSHKGFCDRIWNSDPPPPPPQSFQDDCNDVMWQRTLNFY